MIGRTLAAALVAASVVSGVQAAATVQPVISGVSPAVDGRLDVDVLLTNAGVSDAPAPDSIAVTTHLAGRDAATTLLRIGATTAIRPGGFASLRYRSAQPIDGAGAAVLSLGTASGGYAFAMTADQSKVAVGTPPTSGPPSDVAPGTIAARDNAPMPGNGFLGNLSSYGPIYAAFGHGTDSDGKLELGFKYQLFGRAGDPVSHWYDGIHFAYTQYMYWDVGHDSAPFRDVNYQPELLYIYRHPADGHGDVFGAQGGFLHQSNGRGGDASRGYNLLYIQPQAELPLGRWTVSVAPRFYAYVIDRSDNPDIARYRGHQSLAVSIGEQDGIKLSTVSRYNFGSGKGSVDADLSYPLTHIWHDLPLYVVVQGFTGYGEDLLDYDRKQTRLRVGLGIVR